MLPEFAADLEAKERFLREAKAAAKITHDNVVTVYEADERQGVPYIAMQFLQGYPLDEFLRQKGAPALPHVIRIAREAALGLAAAHELGLVHRDIKPANLWLEAPNGRVKVLDFGLAKPVGSDAELTKSGAVVGTPAYMSPEQARGSKVDARTDLFSLGAVLYRLCTGRTPFAGPNVMAVLMALGSDDPTPARELNPGVPEPLAQFIHLLLSKKPDQRPQTAIEVAKRLRTILEQLLAPGAPAVAPGSPAQSAAGADLSVSQPVVVHALPHHPPIVVPMEVTARPEDVFANLGADDEYEDDGDEPTQAEPVEAAPEPARAAKKGRGVLTATGGVLLLAAVAVGAVLTLKGKKAEVAEKPEGVQPAPGDGRPKPAPKAGPEPWTPGPEWKPVPVGTSPFDKLDAKEIPRAERFDWQPKELVAVIGSHKGRMWGGGWAQFSPDNKYAVAGSEPIIWEVATGAAKWSLTSVRNRGYTPAGFSADGKRVFVVQWEGVVAFDLTDNGPKPTKAAPDGTPLPLVARAPHRTWALAERGRTLVYGAPWDGETTVELYDVTGAEPRKTAELKVAANAYAPGTSQLVYVTPDGKTRRTTVKGAAFTDDAELAVAIGPKHTSWVVSPDGARMCFRDEANALRVWDTAASPPKELHTIPFEAVHKYDTFAPAPGGRWLADMYSEVGLRRIDGPTVGPRVPLETNGSSGQSTIAFSADGTRAVTVSDVGFVRFWDLGGAEPKESPALDFGTVVTGWSHPVQCDRGRLHLYRPDGTPHQLWDLTGSRPVPGPPLGHVPGGSGNPRAVVMRGGGRFLEQSPGAASLRQFEAIAGQWQQVGEPFGRPDWWYPATGRPLVVTLSQHNPPFRMEGWDLAADPPKRAWSVSAPDVDFSAWQVWAVSDDARAILTPRRGKDKALEAVLWRNGGAKPEVYAALPIACNPGNYRAALSADGRYLVHTPTAPHIAIALDLSGKEPREVWKADIWPNGLVLDLDFHPRGALAMAHSGGVRVLDATTGKESWKWDAPGAVERVGWAPDGRHLFLLNGNKTVYALRLDPSGAADRAAAEWALSVGGRVVIRDANGERPVRAAAELPPGPFEAVLLALYDPPARGRVADADLARLPGLRALRELSVAHSPITDDGLGAAVGLTALTVLGLDDTRVTDAGLAHLARLTALQRLHLDETGVTDAGVEALLGFGRLTTLTLKKTRVTAAGVQRLAAALPNCKIEWDGGIIEPVARDRAAAEWVLSKGGTVRVNNDGREVKNAAELPAGGFDLAAANLRANAAVTDADLARLKGCAALTGLNLDGTAVTGAGAAGLKGLRALTKLELRNAAVTDAGLADIKDLKGLVYLELDSAKVTGAGLAHLAGLDRLEGLGLNGIPLTDADLAPLKQLKGLKGIGVARTGLTAKQLEDFHAAVPGCRIYHDGGTIEPKK